MINYLKYHDDYIQFPCIMSSSMFSACKANRCIIPEHSIYFFNLKAMLPFIILNMAFGIKMVIYIALIPLVCRGCYSLSRE